MEKNMTRTIMQHEITALEKVKAAAQKNDGHTLQERLYDLIALTDEYNPSRARLYRQWMITFISQDKKTQTMQHIASEASKQIMALTQEIKA
jgi:predicted lipase